MRIDRPYLSSSSSFFDMRDRQTGDVTVSPIQKNIYTPPVSDNEYVQLGYIRESRLQQYFNANPPVATSPFIPGSSRTYLEIRDTTGTNAVCNFTLYLVVSPPLSGTITAGSIIFDTSEYGYRVPNLTISPSEPIVGSATSGCVGAFGGIDQGLTGIQNIVVRREAIPASSPTQYGIGVRIKINPALVGSSNQIALTVNGMTSLIKG